MTEPADSGNAEESGLTEGERVDLVVKAWEACHGVAKSNGESAWTLRTWGLGIWAALVAYAFKEQLAGIAGVALVVLIFTFVMELGIRQIQYAFLQRALELEKSLNDALVGDSFRLPPKGLSTDIGIPSLGDLLDLLRVRRWLLWSPYVLLVVPTVLLMVWL